MKHSLRKLGIASIVAISITPLSAIAGHHTGTGHSAHGSAGHHNHMYNKIDTNQDGKVNKDEFNKHWNSMFEKMDIDKSGDISKEEFNNHRKLMHPKKYKKTYEHHKDKMKSMKEHKMNEHKMKHHMMDKHKMEGHKMEEHKMN